MYRPINFLTRHLPALAAALIVFPAAAQSGPPEGVCLCPTDINGDGFTDVNDLVAVITDWGMDGSSAADVDGSGLVDVNDLVAIFTAWGPCPIGDDCFGMIALSGAVPSGSNGMDLGLTGFAYETVPVEFRVQAFRDPALLPPLMLVADTGGAGMPTQPTLIEPLLFDEFGLSQPMLLPPQQNGQATRLLVVEPDLDYVASVEHLWWQAGPAVAAQAFDCRQWQEIAFGQPFNIPQDQLEMTIDPGPDGFLQVPPQPIPGLQPDDPLSDLVDASDAYIVRLFDDLGQPAANQPVRIDAEDPSVIGFRRTGFEDETPQPSFSTTSTADGFVIVRVAYLNEGLSGLTFTSEVDDLAPPVPGPALDGLDAAFEALARDPAKPAIRSLRVTKCITNPGTDDEQAIEVNKGLGEDSPYLVYGVKYEVQATLTGPLPADASIRWCIVKFGNEVEVVENDGKICVTVAEPPEGETPPYAHVLIRCKIVCETPDGPQATGSEKMIDVDVKRKKVIKICPIQFGEADADLDKWKTMVGQINAIYNGTGICFSAQPVNNASDTKKKLCLRGQRVNGDPNYAYQIDLDGELVNCVNGNAALEGKPDKITVYYGLCFETGGPTGNCTPKPGFLGWGIGSKTAADELKIKLPYLTGANVKFANSLGMKTGRLDGDADANGGMADMAHEIGHILGLVHNDGTVDNLMHPDPETAAQERRVLRPDQLAKIYKGACGMLD